MTVGIPERQRQSSIWVLVVMLVTAVPSWKAAEQGGGKHLFILSGQSNMVGLDPNASFTPAVNQAFGAGNVIVVKDAVSGQPIRRWYKKWKPAQGDEPQATGDLYDKLMAKVRTAISGQQIASVTFIWMQGERDAKEKHGEVYAASLLGLLEQLETDLNRKPINFVIGRLSDFDMQNKGAPHWTMVRDAQVAVANQHANIEYVDTDDLNGPKNELHYVKPAGYKELGARFAAKAIELINKTQ